MPKLSDSHAKALETLAANMRALVNSTPNDLDLGLELYNALGTELKAVLPGEQTGAQVHAEKVKALRAVSRKLARKVAAL